MKKSEWISLIIAVSSICLFLISSQFDYGGWRTFFVVTSVVIFLASMGLPFGEENEFNRVQKIISILFFSSFAAFILFGLLYCGLTESGGWFYLTFLALILIVAGGIIWCFFGGGGRNNTCVDELDGEVHNTYMPDTSKQNNPTEEFLRGLPIHLSREEEIESFDEDDDYLGKQIEARIEEVLTEMNRKLLLIEMAEAIDQEMPDTDFKYPAGYSEYDGFIGIIGWSFPKGESFIKESLEYLKTTFEVNNLVPFAVDVIDDEKEPTQYACFLIDGIKNDKVVTVFPFGPKENFYQEEYNDIDEWFNAKRIDMMICNIMTLDDKPKCLGLDLIDNEACGPLVAIPMQLLDGCRLIMTTDAGLWYAENDDIKTVVEKYGFGLHVLSVREVENENVEVVMETTDVKREKPRTICIEGVEANLPDNAYILATPFAGEFFVKLETEDPNGNRELLWADDYIYK